MCVVMPANCFNGDGIVILSQISKPEDFIMMIEL